MSDLALIDVTAAEQPSVAKSFALVGPFSDRDAGTDATLAAVLNALPGDPAVIAGPAASEVGRKIVDVRDRRLVSRSIADVDAVIVVAPAFGTNLATAGYLAKMATAARLRGQVVAFISASAVSVGSAGGRWLARTAIHNADLTIVRDEASADALVAAGVDPPLRIGADPAWNELGELFAARKQNDSLVVALDNEASPAAIERLANALSPVAASGIEIFLQSWTDTRPSAGPVAELVAERLGNNVSIIEPPATLREARDVYSTSRAVVAMRFHAVMAAACAGTRTIALGDNAIQQLAATLGLPVVPKTAGSADISNALLHTIEHGPAGSRAVPQLIDRAKASVDLVRLLLTEGEDTSQSANNPLPLYPQPWRS